jgi:multicomponent Na+:H+ antiporter subunit F
MIFADILPWILGVLGAASILCVIRAVLGPTAPDRMVAIDTLTVIVVLILTLLSVYYRASIYLDIALIYAFLNFLGTVALAKYLEGRGLET